MTKERFAEIKKEYNMTSDEIDKAIGVVITLLEEEITELEQAEYDITDVEIAADEVAALCEYIEEVM
jgi:hypothetical protein